MFSYKNNDRGPQLVYGPDSLIEQLRGAAGGANVYWAKVEDADYSGRKSFVLNKCTIPSTNETLPQYDFENVRYFDTINQHSIIIFDSTYSAKTDSHSIVSDEFDLVVDKILYDYKYHTGNIPRINLVPHSRGTHRSLDKYTLSNDLFFCLFSAF